jgi:hypothetical protein
MTLTRTTDLAIAELAIYIVLLQPTLYLLWKHGRPAILTFFYLSAFMILRIVAAAITISDRNDARPSTTGEIISSIGLSPLLLSYASFISTMWTYYGTSARNQLVNTISEAGVHVGAVTGIALVAVGGSKLAGSNITPSDISTAHTLLEVGAVILLVTWIAVVLLFVHFSARVPGHMVVKILMAVAVAFIGTRAIYAAVYAFDHDPRLSPFTGTFAVKLVLIVLVQLFAALCIVAAAWVTRNDSKRVGDTLRRHTRRDVESRHGAFHLGTMRSQK